MPRYNTMEQDIASFVKQVRGPRKELESEYENIEKELQEELDKEKKEQEHD